MNKLVNTNKPHDDILSLTYFIGNPMLYLIEVIKPLIIQVITSTIHYYTSFSDEKIVKLTHNQNRKSVGIFIDLVENNY